MIKPGLERIKLLLQGVSLPWRAIHVAGTNGKGSVCSYISAMLQKANIRTGGFTSPHLIDRWDCITVDGKPISEAVFRQAEDKVKLRNEKQSIQASSFEVLTATAFMIFKQEQVHVGVVECGMGGRLDSTNVIENPLVTVITSIGLDHEAFLGNTLEAIAGEKAGIMKTGCPCVAESTNKSSVLKALKGVAEEKHVDLHVVPLPSRLEWFTDLLGFKGSIVHDASSHPQAEQPSSNLDSFRSIQLRNQWLAYQAISLALPALGVAKEGSNMLVPAISDVEFPGRFQHVNLSSLTGRKNHVLLDGAHNEQAMKAVRHYRTSMSRNLRGEQDQRKVDESPCTWVIACSSTKGDIFRIPGQDHVVVTEFGPVDGMPWVQPKQANHVTIVRTESNSCGLTVREPDVWTALKRACEISNESGMIITGSLYLASDVLRLLRDAKA